MTCTHSIVEHALNLTMNCILCKGIIASPGKVKLIRGAIAVVRKVRFFKGTLHSGAKFHISVGHTTVMASVTFWGAREIAEQAELVLDESPSPKTNNKGNQQLTLGNSSLGGSADLAGLPRLKFGMCSLRPRCVFLLV